MIVSITNEFYNQIQKLTKKSKDGYTSCLEDIFNFLSDQITSSLYAHPHKWYERKDWRIIKTYLKNSGQNLSGKNGFRLVYAANNKESLVVLLYIFPKRGKYGISNLTNDEKNDLIKSFFKQCDGNELIKYDLKRKHIVKNKLL